MKKVWSVLFVLALTAAGCGGGDSSGQADRDSAVADSASSGDGENATGKTAQGGNKSLPGKRKDSGSKDSSKSADASGAANEGTDSNTTAAKPNREQSESKPAAPLSPGTYAYDTDGQTTVSGGTRPMPDTTTLDAEAPQDGVQIRVRDLRDSEGNGTVTETHLAFAPEGVYLTYVKVTSRFPGGLTDVREFRLDPPELIAPTDAGPGFSRSFVMEGSGTRAKVRIKALRFEKVTVDAHSINTLVVDTKIVFSGAIVGEQNSLSWFWPKHIAAVKEHVETDVRNGPIRAQSEYDAILRELQP